MDKHDKINIGIECGNRFYTNFDTKIYWENTSHINLNLEKIPTRNIFKIIIGLEQIENLDIIKEYLPYGFYIENYENKVGLIMIEGSTKWNGIESLLKYHYRINKESIVSFGDADIDLEMIEKSGIGVAVENANVKIKSKAKFICKSNDEDGVAKWIEENILTKRQTST
jgi:hydroxymethylpyrimidine pyrophosphatase-like HAD family hydrolase